MKQVRHILPRLSQARDGAVIIEFALLAPLFIGLLLGVVQVGIGMQSYNAIRNVASDVSRDVMIEYLTSNKMSATSIKQTALATSVAAPYLLDGDSLDITVEEAETQRVDGAREFTFSIKYDVPTVLDFMGFDAPTIEHTRPIFVIKDSSGSGSSSAT